MGGGLVPTERAPAMTPPPPVLSRPDGDAVRLAELRATTLIERTAGTAVASTTVVIFLIMVALRTGSPGTGVALWSVAAWGQIAFSACLRLGHRRAAGRVTSRRWTELMAVSSLWAGGAASVWVWAFCPWDDKLAVAIVLMALVAYWLGAAVCLASSSFAFGAFSLGAVAGPVPALLLEGGDYTVIGLLSLPLAAAIAVVHVDLRGQVVTQMRHREDLELLAAQQTLVFDSIAEAVLTLDRGLIGACNARFCELVGATRDECLGRPLPEVLGGAAEVSAGAMVADGRTVPVVRTEADGRVVHLELRGQGIPARDDHEVWLCADVTEREQREREMRTLAAHDDLTGLLNRRALHDHLHEAFGRRTRPAGVLLVDLDGFKAVNDAHGHAVGDQVLTAVAERLRAATALAGATVGRIGGDEFVVVVEEGTAHDVERVADVVCDACRRAVPAGPSTAHLSASVGVVVVAPLHDVTTALRNADRAMYRAKQAGGDRWVAAPSVEPVLLEPTP
jgi:diguanylate cyclase (GGDEF)-like protein/PAS domain S-box-containing protein